MKPTLYLDVDDTIIAKCHTGSGFDLRPGVMTQLRVLSRLFKVRWLTCWPREPIFKLTKLLYGMRINRDVTYANWGHGDPWRKASYVLDPKAAKNWWWLEDPPCHEEMEALESHNLLHRYVRVEPYGNWAFLDAVNELFRRAGIGDNEITAVGGKPEWFSKEAILTENPAVENMSEVLSMIKLIAGVEHMTPEQRLQQVQKYVQSQINSLYPVK